MQSVAPPPSLPRRAELLRALARRDTSYEGVFVTAVRTTGIFCRPGCRARMPLSRNVEFFATCGEALIAGYRACKRCNPLAPAGAAPAWLQPLLDAVDADPAKRWRDRDLRAIGIAPARAARWFKEHHRMTFHAYTRARRLGVAVRRMSAGDSVTSAAFDAGYESLSGFNEAFQQFAGGSPTERKHAPLVHVERIETPLGAMIACATDRALVLLEFADRRMLATQVRRVRGHFRCAFTPGNNAVLTQLRVQLAEYFRTERVTFDVPVDAPGSAFQTRVWSALRNIPPGVTRSYAEIARELGTPTAVRAVARANGDNRLAILIPCHRVIGADGALTGYGGGLWRKQRLLELEAGAA